MESQLGKEITVPNPRWKYDCKLIQECSGIVGVDEAGRGCLAGPVVAGCVILPANFFTQASNRKHFEKINDSKKFDEPTRENLFERIQNSIGKKKLYGATGSASVSEINEYNIVGATCLAMQRAMLSASRMSGGQWLPVLKKEPDLFSDEEERRENWHVLVDGRPMKKLIYQHQGLIKGDTISLGIAMASILAKVIRDRSMRKLSTEFPEYGFSSNKGYGAPVHLEALQKFGPTVHHRNKFIRNLLNETDNKLAGNFEQTQLSLA